MVDYSFFDSLFDSVIVIDQDGKITYCNEAAATLAGSSVRRLTRGAVFNTIYHLDDPELFPVSGGELGRDAAAPMREINFSIKNSEKQGKLQVTVQPFLEGESNRRWILIMHDVTLEETLHKKYQGELEQKEVFIKELQKAKEQLEDYSKNLEKMVEERTAQVQAANRMLSAIMDSLGQGFFVFDKNGQCGEIFTKACGEILETLPSGKLIWDVLKIEKSELDQFKKWMVAIFGEVLPFDALAELAPKQFPHSKAHYVTLSFYPIRDESGALNNMVVVATDRTREREAELALAKEQSYSQMVLKVIKNRDRFGQFLDSTREMIRSLKSDLSNGHASFDFGSAFRSLHTLEGESGLFSAAALRDAARTCQESLEPFKSEGSVDKLKVISDLKEKVGSLEKAVNDFIGENQELLSILKVGSGPAVEIPVSRLKSFSEFLSGRNCPADVQDQYNETILKQPLASFLKHFNEVAETVARVQGKSIRPVQFDCEGVAVLPGELDSLIASLVHAFRNAVDHGIESPDVRRERGKPAEGSIRVVGRSLKRSGRDWITLVIEDDGGGIDLERLRAKLAAQFPDKLGDCKTDSALMQSIFWPGFTTRDSVGAFSGRGIGMDAIKTEVEKLGGSATVESEISKGTRLTLEFPVGSRSDPVALSA